MSCTVAPAAFAPITLRSGSVLSATSDQPNDDQMWQFDMNAYDFQDLASYPTQFRKHINCFMAATDPRRGGAWSARTARLYMEGLLRNDAEWMDFAVAIHRESNSTVVPPSAYAALSIAMATHRAARYCSRYPNTRCYSELGAQRRAHEVTWESVDRLYAELVRQWRSRCT